MADHDYLVLQIEIIFVLFFLNGVVLVGGHAEWFQ